MSDERASTTILLKAVQFAAGKHQGQRRKGVDASPYINHPIGVAHLLADIGGITDLDTLVAAILHDTIEDTETTADELEKQFGRTVRDVVVEVTDDKTLDKAVRKQLQIEHAPDLSPRAKAIKLADKISNMRDVLESPRRLTGPAPGGSSISIGLNAWWRLPRDKRASRTAIRRDAEEGTRDARRVGVIGSIGRVDPHDDVLPHCVHGGELYHRPRDAGSDAGRCGCDLQCQQSAVSGHALDRAVAVV